jgi:hypothetical protein
LDAIEETIIQKPRIPIPSPIINAIKVPVGVKISLATIIKNNAIQANPIFFMILYDLIILSMN